ncbi:MAG: hypothetical protein KY397_00075 [Gemmatimonadetes bacterium]|nr:hypothetical protein [Gemmatimonadota bacterium]
MALRYPDPIPWVSLLLALAAGCGVRSAELRTPRPVPRDVCVVVGLLGGFDAWDDSTKGVRRLALELRRSPGILAETFENRRSGLARAFLVEALDADRDGRVSSTEAARARVVIYGQSLGGGAAAALARALVRDGVEVELLLLIDSVGRRDDVAPPSVANAAVLYQDEGWFIAGEPEIRPLDPRRTRILGAWQFDYDRPPGSTIPIDDLAWHESAFRIAHARMDRDPRVWATADSLIRAACTEALEARG